MATDLSQVAKTRGIKYFLISFVDLFGNLRAKLVPASAIKGMQKDGAGFAGFAAWLDMTPADPDMFWRARPGQPHPATVEPRDWLACRRLVDERGRGRSVPADYSQAPDRSGEKSRIPHEDGGRMRVFSDQPGRHGHF